MQAQPNSNYGRHQTFRYFVTSRSNIGPKCVSTRAVLKYYVLKSPDYVVKIQQDMVTRVIRSFSEVHEAREVCESMHHLNV